MFWGRANNTAIGRSMTKRAKVSAVAGVRVNERELAILKHIEAAGGSCSLGVNEFSRQFACSVATVRNCIKALENKGLVSVQSRFLRNGGQLENEYELMPEGSRVLDLAAQLDRQAEANIA